MTCALRITKIICPSCEGSGRFSSAMNPSLFCMWCNGEKRLPVADARRYADHLYTIAGGGFINGDHDRTTQLEMEEKAERIYGMTGTTAPWLRSGKKENGR